MRLKYLRRRSYFFSSASINQYSPRFKYASSMILVNNSKPRLSDNRYRSKSAEYPSRRFSIETVCIIHQREGNADRLNSSRCTSHWIQVCSLKARAASARKMHPAIVLACSASKNEFYRVLTFFLGNRLHIDFGRISS